MNDSDDYLDKWFYESIERYNKLVTFDCDSAIVDITLSGASSLCVLGKRESGKQIISEYSLPNKFVPDCLTNSLSIIAKSGSDLKLKCGIIPERLTTEIVAVLRHGKLLASQERLNGVQVYSLGSAPGSCTIKDNGSEFKIIENPQLAVGESIVVMSGAGTAALGDLETWELVSTPQWPLPESPHLVPAVSSDTLFVLTSCSSGKTTLYDSRAQKPVTTLLPERNGGEWTVGFREDKVALLSGRGEVLLFDTRATGAPCLARELKTPDSGKSKLKIQFGQPLNLLSVSGLDKNVYVLDVKSENVFTHEGHWHTEASLDEEVLTTSHLWFSERTLISAASNATINCWQFNESSI